MVLILVFFLIWIAASISTAHASFTLEDERKLGKEFYEKLEKANALLQNERIASYIQRLGERVLARSDKAPFDYKFSIIRSSAVNAFATPGGYVYLNQGLINLAENEGQLAGVIAHEIAHVNGRHIAQIIEKQKKLSISTLAAILAGAFLGGSAEVAAAVTSFSVATATALSLKYSREQEEAADRMGMSYLTSAGYDGRAMLDFLRIMRRYEYYSNAIPSYFLTHPGTDERTRYIDALLQTTYGGKGETRIVGNLKRIQTLLLLLGGKTAAGNLPHFQNLLRENPADPDALYGLAVTQERLGMIGESMDTFQQALRIAPEDSDILRDYGAFLFRLGKLADAVSSLRRAVENDAKDADALLYLGRSHEGLGEWTKALEAYRKLEARQPADPDVHYNLAMAYGKAGDSGDSHYHFGIYFKKKEKKDSSLFHFRAALNLFPKDSARWREITREIESLKP